MRGSDKILLQRRSHGKVSLSAAGECQVRCLQAHLAQGSSASYKAEGDEILVQARGSAGMQMLVVDGRFEGQD